jgi:hypothetical protein
MKEKLEEAAERTARAFDNDNYKALMQLFIEGAEWMQEKMYSEEDERKAYSIGLVTRERFDDLSPDTIESAAERYAKELIEAKTIEQHEKTWIKSVFIHIAKWQEKGLKFTEQDMIKFAEYVASYPDKNRNHKSEILHAKSKYDGAERTIDLLKIWLKEYKTK